MDEQEASPTEEAGEQLAAMLEWVYTEGRGSKQSVVVRTYVMLWCLRPKVFGDPWTQADTAKRLGVSRAQFGMIVCEFKEKFSAIIASRADTYTHPGA